jgi:hypothetical protein
MIIEVRVEGLEVLELCATGSSPPPLITKELLHMRGIQRQEKEKRRMENTYLLFFYLGTFFASFLRRFEYSNHEGVRGLDPMRTTQISANYIFTINNPQEIIFFIAISLYFLCFRLYIIQKQ